MNRRVCTLQTIMEGDMVKLGNPRTTPDYFHLYTTIQTLVTHAHLKYFSTNSKEAFKDHDLSLCSNCGIICRLFELPYHATICMTNELSVKCLLARENINMHEGGRVRVNGVNSSLIRWETARLSIT